MEMLDAVEGRSCPDPAQHESDIGLQPVMGASLYRWHAPVEETLSRKPPEKACVGLLNGPPVSRLPLRKGVSLAEDGAASSTCCKPELAVRRAPEPARKIGAGVHGPAHPSRSVHVAARCSSRASKLASLERSPNTRSTSVTCW